MGIQRKRGFKDGLGNCVFVALGSFLAQVRLYFRVLRSAPRSLGNRRVSIVFPSESLIHGKQRQQRSWVVGYLRRRLPQDVLRAVAVARFNHGIGEVDADWLRIRSKFNGLIQRLDRLCNLTGLAQCIAKVVPARPVFRITLHNMTIQRDRAIEVFGFLRKERAEPSQTIGLISFCAVSVAQRQRRSVLSSAIK